MNLSSVTFSVLPRPKRKPKRKRGSEAGRCNPCSHVALTLSFGREPHVGPQNPPRVRRGYPDPAENAEPINLVPPTRTQPEASSGSPPVVYSLPSACPYLKGGSIRGT